MKMYCFSSGRRKRSNEAKDFSNPNEGDKKCSEFMFKLPFNLITLYLYLSNDEDEH